MEISFVESKKLEFQRESMIVIVPAQIQARINLMLKRFSYYCKNDLPRR